MKFPHLEQMRAERDQREDAITAPYKTDMVALLRINEGLRETVKGINRALANEMRPMLLERAADQLSQRLLPIIEQAVRKVSKNPGPFMIEINPMDIRPLSPQSIEQMVLKGYAQRLSTMARFSIHEIPADHSTVVQIDIPSLSFRHAFTE